MAFIKIRQNYRQGLPPDKFSFFLVLGSVFFCAIGAIIILFSWKGLPPRLPIFYSMPWGETYLGAKAAIWVLPAFSLLILVINLVFMNFFVKNNVFLGRILAVAIFLCAFLAIYDLVKIIYILV